MSTQPADSGKKTSSTSLNRQIGLYSLAAAVAGVSMLALAEPAAGEVVITKKTIPIPIAPYLMPDPVKISMANNGIDNFSFILFSLNFDNGLRGLSAHGVSPSDGVIAGGTYYPEALALPRGAKIGPSAHFNSGPYIDLVEGTNESKGSFYSRGYWGGNPKNHYLGVRFLIGGQTHYGWIRLTVTSDVKLEKPTLTGTITAYAYETVPNKMILAGTAEKATAEAQVPENMQKQAEPSLGMLALGAEGLPLWRKEESSGSNKAKS